MKLDDSCEDKTELQQRLEDKKENVCEAASLSHPGGCEFNLGAN